MVESSDYLSHLNTITDNKTLINHFLSHQFFNELFSYCKDNYTPIV